MSFPSSPYTVTAGRETPQLLFSRRSGDAERMYNAFVEAIESKYGIKVETGVFQAMMEVYLVNDGPVTLLLDSKNL